MHWCEDLGYIVVGGADGKIRILSFNVKRPNSYNELPEFKVHKGKVTAVWADPDRKLIYSIGDDTNFRCYDMKNKSISFGKDSV